jgi:hypothetical protein
MNNPQLPEAFQSVINFGALKGYFPLRKASRWGNLVFLFLLWGGAVAAVLYGVYQAYRWQSYGPVMIEDRLRAPLILAFILFVVGLLVVWVLYVNWKKAAAVYEHGLAYASRKGLEMWRWEEVAQLLAAITRHYTNGIYTGTTHVYTLIDPQNRRLVLNDSLTHVEELGKTIEAQTFPLLYASVSAQYNSGTAVPFGPVTISKSGIQFKNKVYPWTDVKEVSIRRGILQVSKKDGGWFSGASAAVAGIPNLRVLLSIIDQVVGIKTA